MKEQDFITPSTNKAAAIKYLSGLVPTIRIERNRGLYVFPVCEELAAAIESLRRPDTIVNLRGFLDSLTSTKELLFSTLSTINREEAK